MCCPLQHVGSKQQLLVCLHQLVCYRQQQVCCSEQLVGCTQQLGVFQAFRSRYMSGQISCPLSRTSCYPLKARPACGGRVQGGNSAYMECWPLENVETQIHAHFPSPSLPYYVQSTCSNDHNNGESSIITYVNLHEDSARSGRPLCWVGTPAIQTPLVGGWAQADHHAGSVLQQYRLL